MDWRAALVEHGAVSGAVKVRQRRFYPVEKKPRMVEQKLGRERRWRRPTESTPNLLFLWRRQYCEGRLTAQDTIPMRLPPVTVMDAPPL